MKITHIIRALVGILTLPVIGFILMLAGPAILILAGLFTSLFGHLSPTAAEIVAGIALFLPGIGAVICIISLFWWKKTGIPGRTLAIVTIIMCNPFFYLSYLFICASLSMNLAGRSFLIGM